MPGEFVQQPAEVPATEHSSDRSKRIQAEQIKLLYANAPTAFVVTVLNAFVLTLLQWEVIGHGRLVAWLSYILTVAAARAALAWTFARHSPAPSDFGPWGTRFGVGTVCAGLGWGAAGIWLFADTSIAHQIFLTFVLAGMTAGGLALLSVSMPVFWSFMLPALLPITFSFLMRGDTLSKTMGAMVLLYAIAMGDVARRMHQTLVTSLRLRFENIDLVRDLSVEITERGEAENALRRSHDLLKHRVAERTLELSRINEALRSEIGERKLAEDERARLEDQLRQSQKMEAIGQLAGGIAHDFNNLLTVILTNSHVLLEQPCEPEIARLMLEEIRQAGLRAATLTRQLLEFSRQEIRQMEVLDLNEIVTDMETMLRRVIGEDIELVVRLEPAVGHIRADRSQIEQVIMNLVVNSRDAMPHGGRLTIQTSRLCADEAGTRRDEGRRQVVLVVRDTGEGMDEETRARIFEPFFTTKEQGKGTGLGLSTVYGIVTQSGGRVEVASEPGRGTAFSIYLTETVEQPKRLVRTERSVRPSNGEETILLIEDDEQVRTLTQRLLDGHGYRVLYGCNGEDAIRLYRTHGRRIDLLLTDVVMPGMNGVQLAQELKREQSDLRVLFVSGYSDHSAVESATREPGTAFLRKPFTEEDLFRKIREALEG